MKISVIIPVYRVEQYLEECVDSVLGQDYPELEIILVDDGSPDGSGALCDRYAAQDSRVQAIHKENGGLGSARNAGVAAAQGEYVLFLDSDDCWDDIGAVRRLVRRVEATGADVLNYSYRKWNEETGEKMPYLQDVPDMPQPLDYQAQLAYLTERGLYLASACNKLIRRSLLTELPFQTGVYCEDVLWCARLLHRASSMDFVCENFYCYRQRAGSIRHSIKVQNCSDLAHHIEGCIRLAEDAPEAVRKAILGYAAFQYGTFFLVQAQAEDEPRVALEKLAAYTDLLRHGVGRKLQILRAGCRVLGYRNLCRVIRTLYRIKQ